jgi:hypothetical protein
MQYYDKTTKKEGTMINKLHEIADQIDKLCKDMALSNPCGTEADAHNYTYVALARIREFMDKEINQLESDLDELRAEQEVDRTDGVLRILRPLSELSNFLGNERRFTL